MEIKKDILIPYSVYLREDQIRKLRNYSERRRASEMVRRAIDSLGQRSGDFEDGMKLGMENAIQIVKKSRHGSMLYPHGKTMGEMISEEIRDYIREKL